jgi:hypothetical protein
VRFGPDVLRVRSVNGTLPKGPVAFVADGNIAVKQVHNIACLIGINDVKHGQLHPLEGRFKPGQVFGAGHSMKLSGYGWIA